MATFPFTDAASATQNYDLDGTGTTLDPFRAKSPALIGALNSSPATTPNAASASLNSILRGLWQAIIDLGVPPTANDYNIMGTATSGTMKNSSGQLFLTAVTNLNASTRYFQLFNLAAPPAAGTVPIKSYPVYGGGGFTVNDLNFYGVASGGKGLYFSTGISWGMSTTATTYTAATPSETIVEGRFL